MPCPSFPISVAIGIVVALSAIIVDAQEQEPTIAREGQAKVPLPEVPRPDPNSAQVPDGCHPNPRGHRELAEPLRPALLKAFRTPPGP